LNEIAPPRQLKRSALNALNLIEQIESHRFLYLLELGEPRDNVLRLIISQAQERKTPEDVVIEGLTLTNSHELIADEACTAYEIIFQTYVAYSVVNESFASVDDSEIFTGHLFRTYSKSRFLDYIGVATFASDDFPGKLTHYGVNCLNHFIDVVSSAEPIISVIRDAPNKSLDASGGSASRN
jgi:hypothetical protein